MEISTSRRVRRDSAEDAERERKPKGVSFCDTQPSDSHSLHRLFYAQGKKQVPEVELSPLAMAVWFMDDGCRSRNAVYLNTQQFDWHSQHVLLRLLREQWGS